MDVIHEWKIDRFGKLDWQSKSGWVVNETPDMSLKILSSRKLVISSSNVIVVSIIIIPWSSCIVIVAGCFKHISIKHYKYKCAIYACPEHPQPAKTTWWPTLNRHCLTTGYIILNINVYIYYMYV